MDEDITDDVDRGDAKSRPRRFDGLSGGVSGGVSVPVLCTANFCVYACVRVRKQRASRVRECVPGLGRVGARLVCVCERECVRAYVRECVCVCECVCACVCL